MWCAKMWRGCIAVMSMGWVERLLDPDGLDNRLSLRHSSSNQTDSNQTNPSCCPHCDWRCYLLCCRLGGGGIESLPMDRFFQLSADGCAHLRAVHHFREATSRSGLGENECDSSWVILCVVCMCETWCDHR